MAPEAEREKSRTGLLWGVIVAWVVSLTFSYPHMEPQLSVHLGVRVSPDRALFIATLLVFAAYAIRGRIHRRPLDSLELTMILFTVFCTVSWLASGVDQNAEHGLRWLNTLFNLAYFPFLIYFLMKRVPYTRTSLRRLLGCLCLVGFYLCLVAVLEHFQLYAFVWPKYIVDPSLGVNWGRPRGPFLSAAIMGHALIVTFLSALVAITDSARWQKAALAALLGLSAIAIYFNYTRAIWVSFAASVLVLFLLAGPRIRTPLRWIVLMAALAGVSGVTSKMSFAGPTLFQSRQAQVDYRILNYKVAWEVAKSHPFAGVGYGKFGKELETYYLESPGEVVGSTSQYLTDGNHNTYLGLLAELGVFGFALYMFILYRVLQMCLATRARVAREEEFERIAASVGVALLVVVVISGQFADLRFENRLLPLMFMWFGVISGLQFERERLGKSAASERPTRARLLFRPEDTRDLGAYGESLRGAAGR